MLRPSERHRVIPFEMTPMIDVVLQLIIFFLFTSQFQREMTLPIDLPEQPGERRESERPDRVTIDIDADGVYHLGAEPIALERIVARLGAGDGPRSSDDAPTPEVVIRADRAASAASLNRLAEALAEAGVRRWRLGTSPGTPGGGGR